MVDSHCRRVVLFIFFEGLILQHQHKQQKKNNDGAYNNNNNTPNHHYYRPHSFLFIIRILCKPMFCFEVLYYCVVGNSILIFGRKKVGLKRGGGGLGQVFFENQFDECFFLCTIIYNTRHFSTCGT